MMKLIISLIGMAFLLIAVGMSVYVWRWEHRPHVLEIYCFALDSTASNPGNLAIFIRSPDGHTILIDGGKSNSISSVLTSLMPFYRRTINTIISTNPDDSHVTGLMDVISRYHIDQVIEASSSILATSSAYTAFENRASSSKIKHTTVSVGDSIDLGDASLSANILFSSDATNINTPSALVFNINYASTSIIFGGDISKKQQIYLASQMASSTDLDLGGLDNQKKILILPHGENVGVADEAFFDVLKPNIVVVMKKPILQNSRKVSLKRSQSSSTKKTTKPPKVPFTISSIPDVSIFNLATDGNIEFISDGFSFSEKKLSI